LPDWPCATPVVEVPFAAPPAGVALRVFPRVIGRGRVVAVESEPAGTAVRAAAPGLDRGLLLPAQAGRLRVHLEIAGAAALPSRIVPNAEIEDRLGVDRGWIESRTGVRERRVLRSEESLVDLAEAAAREALAAADVAPGALDAVVVATTSGPYLFPSLACLLHERLGLSAQPAFDVAAACAGFPYALSVADQGVRAG